MIVVFEAITNIHTSYSEGITSILSIQPDNFTKILFKKDCMCINSRTSLESYIKYDYNDWGIKYLIDPRDKDGDISNFDHYIREELLKRFKLLDQPKAKSINESLGILGN